MVKIKIRGKNWQVREVLNRLENQYYGWKLIDVIKDLEEKRKRK